MKEKVRLFLGTFIKVLASLAIIVGVFLLVKEVKTNKIENTQTIEEPKELERVKYYVDSYDIAIKRVLKYSETLEGENLLREIELSKLQKAELDVELLSDKTMLNSVAYYDIESFRLKTDEFLRVLELLAKKEKIPMKDSNIASEWWKDLTDLLTRYYTKEEKAERVN